MHGRRRQRRKGDRRRRGGRALPAAAAARADEAIASGGARRGPGALPGAEATRLVAARASAWANQATSMLATPGSDARRAKALLKRALDAREAMAKLLSGVQRGEAATGL